MQWIVTIFSKLDETESEKIGSCDFWVKEK